MNLGCGTFLGGGRRLVDGLRVAGIEFAFQRTADQPGKAVEHAEQAVGQLRCSLPLP